jgi:transposase
MTKYTSQFKLAVVEQYINGLDGYKEVGRQHGIAYSLVKRWVAFYRCHGADGLKKKSSPPYRPEFKLSVLRYMWDNKLSYDATAARFDIRAQSSIGIWERSFLDGGMDALMPPPQGRDNKMPHRKTSSPPPAEERPHEDTRSRDELLEELNYLRMENAYLKKLKALVQAEQQAAAQKAKRK